MLEMEEFQTKVREDARVKMKLSKQLLEIRQKENALVRLKHYDEAEKVRITADRMEQKERQKMEDDVNIYIYIYYININSWKIWLKRRRFLLGINSNLHWELY